MKKLIALTLALVLFTLCYANAAEKTDAEGSGFPDVDSVSGYAAEVNALTDSGVIKGDETGNFRPNDEITRAEFAAVLCRAIGVENIANLDETKNQNYFTDVPPEHWAAGYVNADYDYGAISGYGAGIFAPEEPVTNEQVIKMLVAAWGYTSEAEELGGYPNGYMEVAYRHNVLDTVSFNYGNASKRWVVSMFVYGVLEKLPVSDDADKTPLPPLKPQTTGNDTKQKPLSEYKDTYVSDPVAVLKKITPESAKYEETIFLQGSSIENIPFEVKDKRVCYNRPINELYVGYSITNPNSKDIPYSKNQFTEDGQSFDISALPVGEWYFGASVIDGAVRDSYGCNIIVSDVTIELKGNVNRSTTLNAQPEIAETRNKITLSNETASEHSPFDLKAVYAENGKFVFVVDYPNVLQEECRFYVDLYTEETGAETLNIEGADQKPAPIVFDNLKLDTSYTLKISASSPFFDAEHLQGEIVFINTDGKTDFTFNGETIEQKFVKYEILDYKIE